MSLCFLTIPFQHLHLTDDAVFQNGHIVEQVEGLEHHAHMGAVSRGIDALGDNILAVVENLAGGGNLQQVDAAQQRGLAGAGGADDGGHVALFHGEIDIPQNLMGAEGLGQVVDL